MKRSVSFADLDPEGLADTDGADVGDEVVGLLVLAPFFALTASIFVFADLDPVGLADTDGTDDTDGADVGDEVVGLLVLAPFFFFNARRPES